MAGEGIELSVGLIETIGTERTLEACRATLSPDERARAGRFVHERQRHLFVLAHGLLRYALSDWEPSVAPADWCFAADRHGRPFVVAGPAGAAKPVYFSLSHTEGCVACAIAPVEAVGVDVEQIELRTSLWEIAQHSFAEAEIAALRGLAPDDFRDRFFALWTLKEAYLKARGLGLRLPLDQFAISVSGSDITISFARGIDDDPRRWHFTRQSPSARHRLAIADGSGTPGGLPVVIRLWPEPLA